MGEEEEKEGKELKVSDRRRFVIDEKGEVSVRAEEAAESGAGESTAPEAPAPEEKDKEKKRGFFRRKAKPEPDSSPPPPGEAPMGEIDFSGLVLSLATSGMVQLGEVPDPLTNEKKVELFQAKQTIDILAMLQEKTRGNLTKEEEMLIRDLVTELRLKYVEKTGKSGPGVN